MTAGPISARPARPRRRLPACERQHLGAVAGADGAAWRRASTCWPPTPTAPARARPGRPIAPLALRDEVGLLEPVFARAGAPLAWSAIPTGRRGADRRPRQPGRVRALAIYEPTLFSLIDAEGPAPMRPTAFVRWSPRWPPRSRRERRRRRRAVHRLLDGPRRLAVEFPDARKPAIVASVANAHRWGEALFGEPTPLSAFASLDIPVLYMVGKRSTPSALGVARLLTGVLPRVEVVVFDALDHMGPITQPPAVNDAIVGFLEPQALPSLTASASNVHG